MSVPLGSHPLIVLQSFDFNDPNRTKDLCVVTKKDTGEKYLDKIEKKENTLFNHFLKVVFGKGALADKDTSITAVEKYLVDIYLSDEGQKLRSMKDDTQAYKTTSKIAELAGRQGFHALENLMKVKKSYSELSADQQKKIPIPLVSVMRLVRDNGVFKAKDLQKFVDLVEQHKKLKEKIRQEEENLIKYSSYGPKYVSELNQSISDLKRLQESTKWQILLERYGSEPARKLSVEDLEVLGVKGYFDVIYDEKQTEESLKDLVKNLKIQLLREEAIEEINRAPGEVPQRRINKPPLPVEIEPPPSTGFTQEDIESLKRATESQPSTIFDQYGILDEEIRKKMSEEDIELLVKEGFEGKLNSEVTYGSLHGIIDLLKKKESAEKDLAEAKRRQQELLDKEGLTNEETIELSASTATAGKLNTLPDLIDEYQEQLDSLKSS